MTKTTAFTLSVTLALNVATSTIISDDKRLIDGVRIYNRALTATEIQATYQQESVETTQAAAPLLVSPSGGSVKATTRYVHPGCSNGASTYNPSGAGSCTGGSDRVYSTINNALAAAVAGDVIDIRAGTYDEQISMDVPGRYTSPSITSYANGTFVRGHAGETVMVRPTGFPLGFAGVVLVRDNAYITFENLIFDGSYVVGGSNIFADHFVRFDGVHTQNNGAISGNNQMGGHIESDVEFINSFSHDNGMNCTKGRGSATDPTACPYTFDGLAGGYGLYWKGARGVIRNSKFYNNGAYGLHIYRGDPGETPNDMMIDGNEFYNNGGNYWACCNAADHAKGFPDTRKTSVDIILDSGQRGFIQNNLVRGGAPGSGHGGILTGLGHNGATIRYNTVRGMEGVGIRISPDAPNALVTNNIAVDNGTNIQNDGAPGASIRNNLCSISGGTTNCDGWLQ